MGVFNLFGLVGTRKDGRRSEWSFHLNHEKPSSQIGRKSMWENVYYRKFTILSILATTFPLLNQKRKKKKKSYNISIVINYCNKNIPQNLFKSAFYFFNFPSYLPNTLGDNIFYHSTFLCFIHYLLYLTLPSLIGVHCPSQHAWCDRVHEIVYNEY